MKTVVILLCTLLWSAVSWAQPVPIPSLGTAGTLSTTDLFILDQSNNTPPGVTRKLSLGTLAGYISQSGVFYTGTPAAGQVAIWTAANTVQGLSTLPAGLLPLATSSTVGALRPDNVTTTVTAGVLSATGTGAGTTVSLVCDGTTDNASTIQTAENALVAAGGGRLNLQIGSGNSTCISGQLTKYANTHWYGPGPEAMVLKAKAGINDGFIITNGFATLHGSNSANGMGDWTIYGLSIDGNKANNTAYLLGTQIFDGGSGITAGTYTVPGGTCTTQPTVTVTVSGGAVNGVSVANSGQCSVPPVGKITLTGINAVITGMWSACVQVYGYEYRLEWDMIRNCPGDGLYSEWSNTAGCPFTGTSGSVAAPNCMEAHVENVKFHQNGNNGFSWYGPHDSVMNWIDAYQNGSANMYLGNNGGPLQIVNSHAFGTAQWAYYGGGITYMSNTQLEGCNTACLGIFYQTSIVSNVAVFNCASGAEGVTVGNPGNKPAYTQIRGTTIEGGCGSGSSGHYGLDLTNTAGGDSIDVLILGSTNSYTGLTAAHQSTGYYNIGVSGGATPGGISSFGQYYGAQTCTETSGPSYSHCLNISSNSIGCLNVNGNNICSTPGGLVSIGSTLQIGNGLYTSGALAQATLAQGEMAIAKQTASGSAPGAGFLKFGVTAGTNAGSCKIIAYAGTSTTPVTVVDNVGSGC